LTAFWTKKFEIFPRRRKILRLKSRKNVPKSTLADDAKSRQGPSMSSEAPPSADMP